MMFVINILRVELLYIDKFSESYITRPSQVSILHLIGF